MIRHLFLTVEQIECIFAVPCVFLLSVSGCVGALDPSIIEWFEYAPQSEKKYPPQTRIQVDPVLAEASSPLQKTARGVLLMLNNFVNFFIMIGRFCYICDVLSSL